MPDIDVTEVLADTTVAGETFTVVRRQETVSTGGLVTTQTTTFNGVVGSVTPTGENSLLREEALQTQAKTIHVVTTFLLRGESRDAAGNSFQPDLVLWKGDYYLVRLLSDFSQYGAGMVEAECSSFDYRDLAPASPMMLADQSRPEDSQMEPQI